jgi:cytidyltransferase-like protein
MGGVAGHLAHLYDNRNLTFNEMAKILQKAASGELVGTEKTDGYNIYLGYVDGKPRAARNKGDMSRGGMTFEDLINREFQGGEDSKRAYVTAFNAYVKALESLSEEEKAQIFGPNGEIFYNTEIQGPVAPNVVNYDENVVNIHRMGHKRYNKEENSLEVVANEKESAFLDSVINKFEEATANEPFSVRRTAFLTLNKITDEAFIEEVLNRIRQTGYSGNMTINDYLHDKLTPFTAEALPELDDERVELLVRRMLGDKTAPTTTQITKGMDKEVRAKVSAFNKNSKFLIGKLIKPIEMAIHDFAVELLRGLKSAYILDNDAEVKRLKNETEAAIRAIQDYEGPEKEAAQDILVRQLTKLKHHDNIDTVVEGFVFQYDGQMYKFTGNFAPMNQLLGLFRYGRGSIPQMVKEALLEEKEDEIVAILPGKFKPPHRGHLDMVKHYARLADKVVVLVSPKDKDGITADSSVQILNMYLDDANIKNADVKVADYASPVRAAMEYGNLPEMEGTKIILGASTKGGDAAERFAGNVQKYVENAEVLNPLDYAFDPVGEVLSATDFRNALRGGENIEKFLPETSKDRAGYIADITKSQLKEVNEPFLGIFRGLVDEVLQERAESEKQRRWACAQMGKSRKKFKGKPSLSKKEAEKMCTDPLKEEEELEEISAMGGGAVAGPAGPVGKPKRRNPSEKEVNEALNYLLQKLGV